jgi:hypothetical protein
MKNFKRYLEDGRRVAAFGRELIGEVEIFLLYCSVKDHFNKRFAKHMYEIYKNAKSIQYLKEEFKIHPVILRIPIQEGDSAEYTFKRYMRENFYKAFVFNEYCKRECIALLKEGIVIKKEKFKPLKMDE